ncbi:G-type lectin S-receptor-like serine/threonine-protein kinase At1g11330 isoform X3 [Quercus robur]|uniref:G-type lectin S-receptor-like serine/threonine-protein kinase At1g11330 isoform X3 n=1 Tax=Quercus robur TaxID=38942 RepID=UPI0021613AB3|nr:G-type lectin S-receptor-like serine/threonine-protein kinase At1g11330 isoform X3 [Quercus robur]
MGFLSKRSLLYALCCLCLNLGVARDTISSFQFLKDPDYIISNGSAFRLGFFSPVNSTNRYLGIWYNKISVVTYFSVVWVANRERPLKDSSGVLTIYEDGNLVVLNGQAEILWSSNVSNSVPNSSATLLDSGNLVLQGDTTGAIVWESFQHPCDTILPRMKLSNNLRTNQKIQLTSWKSPSDPSTGRFSAGINPQNIPQGFVWKDNHPYWRTGPWNGQFFTGAQSWVLDYHSGFTIVYDKEETVYATVAYLNVLGLSKQFVDSQGNSMQINWDDEKEDWEVVGFAPANECDVYGTCGAFGNCYALSSPICSCLEGFEPKIVEEWNRGNWMSGCVRRIPLQCERVNNSGDGGGKADGFLKLEMIKVPDFAEWSYRTKDDCRKQCLENCSCVAYAYDTGIGCMSWSGNLIDLQKFSTGGIDLQKFSTGGLDIYIRLSYLEFERERNLKVIITITVIIGAMAIPSTAYFIWRWMTKKRARKNKSRESLPSKNLIDAKLHELPTYSLAELATSTNNFHIANMLGRGGFGTVFKGKLHDGQEIAVKRLSRSSGQGLEEFMNEVFVISKLQHRNLVRLLGCCIEGEENMLIYEYMSNKSLDAIVFDPLNQKHLDWTKRFNIIEGISRGLLYLHRDSRLKIIHRDLKASNILLDEELNPKISDFGIARIFRGSENQANTKRVIGTYGYMSPEYVMQGFFSEKSDVFSFGVLLLEIVSGRKTTCFYDDQQYYLSLVGFAWKLWNDDNIMALVDPTIWDPCFQMEMLRCIHVGLLCVQELARDRPTMSTIISMLNSEILDLPTPKQPAFTERQIASNEEPVEMGQIKSSSCNITITTVYAR